MIHYERFKLDNGLTVLVHEDANTPMAAVNILYKVGSRNEDAKRTGFAHLFEHLMFGGSANIPDFDTPLQAAGGESNAFTNQDITNYYDILPAFNLETAFWLESDRMLSLAFSDKSLEVQRNVVSEEFKEHYINQPYGDVWHKLSALAYKVHPYQWPTIGMDLSHIEQAQMSDVKDFFYKHYRPNNAIMVVAGGVKVDEIKRLSQKWFGEIPAGELDTHEIPQEPEQTEARLLEVKADVPVSVLFKAFPMARRDEQRYYQADLLSDILGSGESSRMYQQLVKEQELFSGVNAYVTGSLDAGQFVMECRLNDGVNMEEAEAGLRKVLDEVMQQPVHREELQKVKNRVESDIVHSSVSVLNRAMNLAFYEWLGNADMLNQETDRYNKITAEDLRDCAAEIFQPQRANTMHYMAENE